MSDNQFGKSSDLIFAKLKFFHSTCHIFHSVCQIIKNNGINYPIPKDTKLKHFDAILLRDVILKEGLVAWVQTYNVNPSKWEVFIERYDQIISDVRYLKVHV